MANLVPAALSTLLLQLLWGKVLLCESESKILWGKCFFAKVKVKLSKWSILFLKVKFGKEVCVYKISRGAQLSGCPLTTEHHFKQQEQLSEAQKKDLFVKGKFDNFGRKYEFVNFKSDRNWSIYQLLLQ